VSKHDLILRSKASTTLRSTTDRIMRVLDKATAEQLDRGAQWYPDGNVTVRDLAKVGGISEERAAIVVAHLSPQTGWQRNVIGAYGLVLDDHAPHCINRNVMRARMSLHADDPWSTFGAEAWKTLRFARNLLGDTSVVTVDIWATRIAFGMGWGKQWRTDKAYDAKLDLYLGRVGVYEAVEHAYKLVGRRSGICPTVVQATTWIVARNGRAA